MFLLLPTDHTIIIQSTPSPRKLQCLLCVSFTQCQEGTGNYVFSHFFQYQLVLNKQKKVEVNRQRKVWRGKPKLKKSKSYVTVSVILFEYQKKCMQKNCYCKLAAYFDFARDIQSRKVSFLGLLSFGFKGLLKAMLFQSIYVQVPSIRLREGSARCGCAYWMEITHPTAQRRRFFRSVCRGEHTSETIKHLYMTIYNEIQLWLV